MVPPVTLASMRRSATLRPRVAALGVAALVAGAALTGCGGDDSRAVDAADSGATTSSTTASPTTSTPGGTATTCSLPGAATTAPSTPSTGTVSLLTAVRTAVHDGCDRIVFEFRDGPPPGYQVEYRPGPFNRGESNEPLEVQGSAYLLVRLDKASGADQSSPTASPTYTGPRALTDLGLHHAVEVVNAEDFEGILTWVIGLDSQRPFTVTTLSSPPRVVVDVS
jgi:hypothetical protein